MQNKKRILLVGGGSGGHIIPNLAIANFLCGSPLQAGGPNCKVELLYIGSRNPLDRTLVQQAGIPFKAIFTGKLRRYFSLRNFIDPFLVFFGFLQSFVLLIRFRPHVVFTKGGFVSLPVVFAAFFLRCPIILHESDALMGLANRIASKMARVVCVSFPRLLTSEKFVLTGNPVRASVRHGDPKQGYELTGFTPAKPVLLVWGGSQGAQEINELIVFHLDELARHFQIVHVAGKNKLSAASSRLPDYAEFEYLDEELPHIYAITDIVFGRAGANSLYELAYVQKPNILLPLKTAAHNHQMLNADYFEQQGASIILRDKSNFLDVLVALAENELLQNNMKVALSGISRPKAAEQIAELILNFKSRGL